MVADKKSAPKLSAAECAALHAKAHAAGMAAGQASVPVPMIVGEAKDIFSNEFKPGATLYHVPDGVCGFAWVNIKPGNSPFANWLKKSGAGGKDDYYGGVTVWVSEFGQSMTRKEAYAHAYAKVLNDSGVYASSMSRMD